MQFAVTVSTQDPTSGETNSTKNNRVFFLAIAFLAVAGIALSAVSLQRHYAKSASAFCDIGEKFNCDIVNRSEYSSLMGIPVAGIGVAGYALLLALATLYRSRLGTPTRLLGAAIAGFGFALYLTYIEGYVLGTWCILCLSSLGIIAAITILASVVRIRSSVKISG
ncbi:MAG TPA: vitamin K epoxide reductase family protein [Candidatus Acidoferrum sp.]|nr:vitamin K epoxide reductase family protein [Candidatus Acidoferrum sp.]